MLRRIATAFAPVLVLAAVTVASPASAYWEYGHQTVAQIALRNVTPRTRAAVMRLLRQGKVLGTPECSVGTIEGASTWADCIKPLKNAAGQPLYGFAYTWHFQDADVCKPFDLQPSCKDGDCVSAQIERDVKLLQSRATPLKARVEALAFLIHFVGDLHQPLHAGDREDQGGNKALASYGAYSAPKLNLHSIWDGYLAERAGTTPPSLIRRYTPAERRRLAAGGVMDWSRESWQVAHDAVYATATHGDPCGPMPARAELSQEDIARLTPIARLELQRGGLRLAKLLDRIYA